MATPESVQPWGQIVNPRPGKPGNMGAAHVGAMRGGMWGAAHIGGRIGGPSWPELNPWGVPYTWGRASGLMGGRGVGVAMGQGVGAALARGACEGAGGHTLNPNPWGRLPRGAVVSGGRAYGGQDMGQGSHGGRVAMGAGAWG